MKRVPRLSTVWIRLGCELEGSEPSVCLHAICIYANLFEYLLKIGRKTKSLFELQKAFRDRFGATDLEFVTPGDQATGSDGRLTWSLSGR